MYPILVFFFFQAEDGIRDVAVTGVQTCALPISNLGAGTITSNLKNTYGRVRLEIAGTRLETGLQLLGSLIGDHAKTAIGTLLGTGTVIGTGANVFDDVRPPKYIPPFAWGGAGGARMSRDGFLKIAGRVLPRRDVVVDDATRAVLERIYDWATR